MTFSFNNMNRYFLFILVLLIKISSENEQNQLERIKNAIYLIISRANGLIEDTSFIFEYEKYNVTLDNMRILKLFNRNKNAKKEISNNETFININEIMINIQGDFYIQLLCHREEKIKYKTVFFELTFDEIKFKLINDFHIEFYSTNIKTFNYSNSINLDFFRAFNNKNKCNFYEGGKKPIVLDDIDSKLKEFFQGKFESKIKEVQKHCNLLTYDMIHIFNDYPFSYIPYDTSESYYISYLEPKKIKLDEEDINLNIKKKSITINNFSIIGIYKYLPYSDIDFFFNFTIDCIKNKVHFRYEIVGNTTKMELILSDCSISDDNYVFETYSIDYYEDIKNMLIKHYIEYLQNKANEYYKDIFSS